MVICVAGDNPNHLGGFSDHNPFRLFVQSRFSALLMQHPEADLVIPLQLGPGTWCAEIAVTHNRAFFAGIVPNAPSRWTEPLIKRHDALLKASGMDSIWNAEEATIPVEAFVGEDVHLLACWDGQRVSSQAARAIRIMQDVEPTSLVVEHLTPNAMPPQYKVLGQLETLRDIFPSNFSKRVEDVALGLQALLIDPTLWVDVPETIKDRASSRLNEVLMLHRLITRLEERR